MFAEVGFCVAFFCVTAPGVPRAAFEFLVAPSDGVVFAHLVAFVSPGVHFAEDVDVFGRGGVVVVPFIASHPVLWQVLGRGVFAVDDLDRSFLYVRVGDEVGTDEFSVERPVVLGVCGGVNSDVSATPADVGFEGDLLSVVENVLGGVEEYDDLIFR